MWLVVLGLLVGLVLLGVVMGLQAVNALVHLRAAAAAAPRLRGDLLDGDEQRLRIDALAVHSQTAKARRAVAGPQWDVVSAVPWVGTNAEALQRVTEVADGLSERALPELVGAAGVLGPGDLKPRGGRVGLAPIGATRPFLESAAQSTGAADQRLAAISPGDLVGPLRRGYVDFTQKVAALDTTVDTAARAARILPTVLGGREPRRYLLLVQNNAEPRALGGIAGSVIELRAERGKVRLIGQRSGGSFGDLGSPVAKLSTGEKALYGTQLGRFMLNVTATPDFPRTAGLAAEMWSRKTGQRVDGVATIDPVALGELLRATGPVTLADGTRLEADNAARVLLNQVYLDIKDPKKQDAYFASSASAIFTHFIDGDLDVPVTTQVLADATGQGRFMFWSAHRPEQAVLSGTQVAGQINGADGGHGGAPTVGVFLHDRTQSKMGYYQDMDVQVVPHECGDGDRGWLAVSVRVASTAPPDAARLPLYITGFGNVVPRGHIASQLFLYAPAGAKISGFTTTTGAKRARTEVHDGLQVATVPLELAPGESVVMKYQLEHVTSLENGVRVRTTPGPAMDRFGVSTSPCA